MQRLFSFAPLHAVDLALALLAGASFVLWFEMLKWLWAKALAIGGRTPL
jgi:hypothetical protein